MEMILIDWTRMGSTYCIAGAVQQGGGMRVVRPLWVRHRHAPVRNTGWSPFLMDGRSRWEAFELVGPEPAAPQPPHCEDVWVRDLKPLGRLAAVEQRRAILEATRAAANRPLFGSPLTRTTTSAYLAPGTGERSLTTVVLPAGRIQFVVSSRPCRRGARHPRPPGGAGFRRALAAAEGSFSRDAGGDGRGGHRGSAAVRSGGGAPHGRSGRDPRRAVAPVRPGRRRSPLLAHGRRLLLPRRADALRRPFNPRSRRSFFLSPELPGFTISPHRNAAPGVHPDRPAPPPMGGLLCCPFCVVC